jgi:hypothetical protein
MAAMAVGSVQAGSGGPDTIHVTKTGGLTVSASGTWSWPEMATASKLSYTGFAIDWGDISTGNDVGTYHIGDGTPASNVVMQTSPEQGTSGSFGAVTHTYAAPGTYMVCAILYDLGEVKPFLATGYHGLRAGGTDRNTDNSVDSKSEVPAMCATVVVSNPTPAPTETPFQSFQGETSQPTSTPPPTSTATAPSTPEQQAPLLVLALLLGSMLASVAAFKTVKAHR